MADQHSDPTTTPRRRARAPKRPDPTFQLLDRVRVRADVESEEGELVYAGCVGTVMARWAHGAAFEVAFTHPSPVLTTVEPGDLELVERAHV